MYIRICGASTLIRVQLGFINPYLGLLITRSLERMHCASGCIGVCSNINVLTNLPTFGYGCVPYHSYVVVLVHNPIYVLKSLFLFLCVLSRRESSEVPMVIKVTSGALA